MQTYTHTRMPCVVCVCVCYGCFYCSCPNWNNGLYRVVVGILENGKQGDQDRARVLYKTITLKFKTGKRERKNRKRTTTTGEQRVHTHERVTWTFFGDGGQKHKTKWGEKEKKSKKGTGWISWSFKKKKTIASYLFLWSIQTARRRWCAFDSALLLDCAAMFSPALRYSIPTDWLTDWLFLCQQTALLLFQTWEKWIHTHTCRHATSRLEKLGFLQNAFSALRFLGCGGLASSTTNGPAWCFSPSGSVSPLWTYTQSFCRSPPSGRVCVCV
jgi:hypothetical protein